MTEFGKEEVEFAVTFEEQTFMQCAFEDHGGCHVPIRKNLPGIGVLLAAKRVHYGLEFFVSRGGELADDKIARLAHYGFAAQVIKLHEYLCVVCSCFLTFGCHESNRSCFLRYRLRLGQWT